MRRPKPALIVVVVLTGAVALVSCSGDEDPHKDKKKVVKPAAATAKPNPPPAPAPGKPEASKPGAAVQATGAPPAPAKSDGGATGKTGENKPVELGGKNDGKTINFTSGKPVITDTPEDKVAIRSALKDFAEASKGVTFGPAKKKPEPPAPEAPKN